MSLLGFLEAGGEAVIRGILSQFKPEDLFRNGRTSTVATQAAIARLAEKGYGRFGYTSDEIRFTVQNVARSVYAAAQLERGVPLSSLGVPIPVAPGSPPAGPTTVGVVVTYRTPTGTADSIVDVVLPNNQVSLPDIIQQATQSVESQLRPGSPPPYRPSDVGAIVSTRVVTVYRGAPMGT